MNKRAQTSYFIAYLIIAVSLVMIASIFVPLGRQATEDSYIAGYNMMNLAKTRSLDIDNVTLRNSIENSINEAIAEKSNNIDIIQNFFQYGWIVVLIMTVLMIFIFARKNALSGGII